MMAIDWPQTPLEREALGAVIDGRIERAREALEAAAASTFAPVSVARAWEREVRVALEDLRSTRDHESARRLVGAWDRNRPTDVPPAAVVMAPWAGLTPRIVWSPEQIQRAVDASVSAHRADSPRTLFAGVAAGWMRQGTSARPDRREWLVAATQLARWLLDGATATGPTAVSERAVTSSRSIVLLLLLLIGALHGGRRR